MKSREYDTDEMGRLTRRSPLKHWLFKMLGEEVALEEANEIVEPHLTGDDL